MARKIDSMSRNMLEAAEISPGARLIYALQHAPDAEPKKGLSECLSVVKPIGWKARPVMPSEKYKYQESSSRKSDDSHPLLISLFNDTPKLYGSRHVQNSESGFSLHDMTPGCMSGQQRR